MRNPPRNTIAKDAIAVWKITATLYIIFLWLFIMGSTIVFVVLKYSLFLIIIVWGIAIFSTYLFVFRIPRLRFRRWRYEVFEQEIYIQHGILIRTRTLIPMIRVQHVDTKQGPILRKFNLASVTISTAATTHEIPALLEEEASELRDHISSLAKVDEDDV
ncbi:MAG TPA: PH domain-containing protein [Bacillota bacterium]|nr:PH domain-containing protein [Bacillota bacterium]